MRRPQYTSQEIHERQDKLPGFNSDGDIFKIFNEDEKESPVHTLWQAVASLTIVAFKDGELHTLAGNRKEEANETHSNTASTPTLRIPYEEAGTLIGESVPFNLKGEIDPLRPFISDVLNPSVAMIPDNTDVLASKVGHLLAQKLELGFVLETARRAIGRASLMKCTAGFSFVGENSSGESLYEPLIKFGILVGLDSEVAKQIPEETASYSNVSLVPTEQYRRGIESKNVIEVLPSATDWDIIRICIMGLCNKTSHSILSDKKAIERHLTEDGMIKMIK